MEVIHGHTVLLQVRGGWDLGQKAETWGQKDSDQSHGFSHSGKHVLRLMHEAVCSVIDTAATKVRRAFWFWSEIHKLALTQIRSPIDTNIENIPIMRMDVNTRCKYGPSYHE